MDNNILYSFAVIGSGGTGTYFLKEFSRYLSSGVHEEDIKLLMIYDGDIVEEKNLSRQAFCEDDIGLNKASVMAGVLNSAFDTQWEAIASYVTSVEDVASKMPSGSKSGIIYMPVIIGCVDNHACRLVLEEYFEQSENCIYFDSANEYTTGEVVLSYKFNGTVVSPLRSKLFPDLKKGSADLRARTEMSCEELNNVAPQHIATNMRAGNILLSEACSLLDKNPHPGLVTFELDTMTQEYVPMDLRQKGAA